MGLLGGPPRRRATRYAIVLLLAVQLGAGGVVVCRTETGHVAVESAWTACCRVIAPPAAAALASPTARDAGGARPDGDCGACADAPLDTAAGDSGRGPQPPPSGGLATVRASLASGPLRPLPTAECEPSLLQARAVLASAVLTI